jgi:hypothetical protein
MRMAIASFRSARTRTARSLENDRAARSVRVRREEALGQKL